MVRGMKGRTSDLFIFFYITVFILYLFVGQAKQNEELSKSTHISYQKLDSWSQI